MEFEMERISNIEVTSSLDSSFTYFIENSTIAIGLLGLVEEYSKQHLNSPLTLLLIAAIADGLLLHAYHNKTKNNLETDNLDLAEPE